jgi:hypothetical protein
MNKMTRTNLEPEPRQMNYYNINGTSDKRYIIKNCLNKYDACSMCVIKKYTRPTECCVNNCDGNDLVGAHVNKKYNKTYKIVLLCRKHNGKKERMSLSVNTLAFTIDEINKGKLIPERTEELQKRLNPPKKPTKTNTSTNTSTKPTKTNTSTKPTKTNTSTKPTKTNTSTKTKKTNTSTKPTKTNTSTKPTKPTKTKKRLKLSN